VVEAAPEFRDWFLDVVREHTDLRSEQAAVESFALVPDLDMAGAGLGHRGQRHAARRPAQRHGLTGHGTSAG
jgi:hypothetical protein